MINKEGGIETMDLNKLKEIQAVVFDMDGLMFDSERYVQKSWDIAGERLGYGPLGHNIVNTLGTNLTNRKKYFLEHYGNDFPFDKFLDGYRDAYYELVEDGVPAKKGLHEILKVLKAKARYLYRSMQTIKSRSIKSDRIRRCNQWNPFRTWSRHESSDDPRYRAGYK